MNSNQNPQPEEAILHLEMDYSLKTCLLLISAGFFVYSGIFVLSHLVSDLFCATYRSLSVREKVWWNLVVARAVFGVQCTVSGLRALLVDPVLSADKITAQQDWTWFMILTATGYFVFENISHFIYNFLFSTFEVFITIHHMYSLLGLFNSVVYSTAGHYLVLVTLLVEMITPFSFIHLILVKAGLANTILWKLNQCIIIHLCHCRTVLTYHLWWVCFCNWEHLINSVSCVYLLMFFPGLAFLTLFFNPLWIFNNTNRLFTSANFKHKAPSATSSENGSNDMNTKKKS